MGQRHFRITVLFYLINFLKILDGLIGLFTFNKAPNDFTFRACKKVCKYERKLHERDMINSDTNSNGEES